MPFEACLEAILAIDFVQSTETSVEDICAGEQVYGTVCLFWAPDQYVRGAAKNGLLF